MAKKKEVGITRKIADFFEKIPSSSPGLFVATSNQKQAKGLADKTNSNPKERQHSIQVVNGHLPQNRNVVFRVQPHAKTTNHDVSE